MEHRLFGTGRLVAVVSTGSAFRGGAKESGASGGWCLARCWVLKARAFCCPGFSVRALPVSVPSVLFCVLGGCWWRGRVVGFRPYFENYTVDASIFVSQVFKGARWMPWYQEPKKDVGICDKPRGVDNQTVIRGFPNGETRLEASPVTPA